MLRRTLVIAAALLTCAAAPPPPKAPAAKAPTAKAPAPKAPAPKAAVTAAFDPRDPTSLAGVLESAGAKAQVAQRVEDTVLVSVTSTAANFTVQFLGCNAQGKACQAALYDSGPVPGTPTLAQINSFNQSSAMCRGFQDRGGRAHVVYSTLVAGSSRDQTRTQLAAWQGCIADFRAFVKDPPGYLAAAP